MNRKKIFLTTSAVILATVGAFAAFKSFSQKIYLRTASGVQCLLLTNAAVSNFGSSGTGQASIVTTGGTSLTVWLTSTCSSSKAYFTN